MWFWGQLVVGRDNFIAVYMMANRRHGTIYVGMTSQLITRAVQHRSGQFGGFTARHGLNRLVWFEPHELMTVAIRRETRLKKYPRTWKVNLIERENPAWEDLLPALLGWRPDNVWGQPRP